MSARSATIYHLRGGGLRGGEVCRNGDGPDMVIDGAVCKSISKLLLLHEESGILQFVEMKGEVGYDKT